jgi:hypothetical protein
MTQSTSAGVEAVAKAPLKFEIVTTIFVVVLLAI